MILQHVKVLAIDQMAGQRQEHPTVAKAVTVEVDPEQALRILLAANVGKLSLILRQPAEVALAPDAKITDRDLFGGDEAQALRQALPAVQAQPAAFQPDPPPGATCRPGSDPARPPTASPPDTPTRKITVVRSVKSEQYDVPRRAPMTEGGVSKQANTILPFATVAPKRTGGFNAAPDLGRDAGDRRRRCAFGLVQAAAPAWARKSGPCHPVTEQVSALKVTLNKSRTLCFSDPFSTAVIGAPEIADVLPMTDSMLYVQGKKVGATNISVFDQQRRLVSVIDLDVTPDTTSLQNKIAASTGGRDINVTSANGEIVLSGEASDGLAAARAVEVAKGLSPDAPVVNAMKVSPSQQVMLKVRILEVDRNAGRDLGISWFGKTNSVSFATGLGSQPTTATNNSGVFPGAGSTASSFGVLLANVVNTHGVSIDVLLSALESKGLVKSLAEPDLVALSGEKATFLAGGEIPVPVVQGTNATNTTLGIGVNYTPNISIEWKQFGVGPGFHPDGPQQRHHQSAAQSVRDRDQHGQQPEHQRNDRPLIDRAQGAYRGRTAGRTKLRDRGPAPGSGFSKHQSASVARQRAGPRRPLSIHRLPEEPDRSRHHRLSASREARASGAAFGDPVRYGASVE